MMAVGDATQWYTKKEGDPDTGFISATDAIAAVTQTYTDFEATTITAGTGLTGGGDLSANRTLSVDTGGIDTAQLADGAVTLAKSSGLLPVAPTAVKYVSTTGWYAPAAATRTTSVELEGFLNLVPIYLWAGTIESIAAEITSAGLAGALVRLGLYADNNGAPGSLVFDAGTIDGTVVGVGAIGGMSHAITAGAYWTAAVVQGGAATRPTTRCVGQTFSYQIATPSSTQALANVQTTYYPYRAGVTGALPSPAGASSPAGAGTQIVVALKYSSFA